MKTISVSNNLHKWIMDHKNSERTSAEKVIYGLIGEVDCLNKQVTKLENTICQFKKTNDFLENHLEKAP